MEIPLDLIKPNPEQPRQEFDQESLNGLAQSIASVGVIQPIVVYKNGDGYILLDGERRWRAARLAGLDTIPVFLREDDETKQKLSLALVANLQRDDLNPIEEARAFERLRHDFGLTQTVIGKMVGKSDVHVSGRLKLLELDEEIQQLVAARSLTPDYHAARSFLSIEDTAKRIRLAKRCAVAKCSIKTIERMCAQTAQIRKVKSAPHQSFAPQTAKDGGVSWNSLEYPGKLPASRLRNAAEKTCEVCPMFDVASDSTCRTCPLVEFVKYLVKDVNASEVDHE